MTEHANQPTLKEVKWKDIREAVARVNPGFAAVIDGVKLNDKCRLYKAKYPFGSTIIKEGVFYCPTNDGLIVPLQDIRISSKIHTDLGYTDGIPPGIILNHSVELFLKPEENIMPFVLMRQGLIFGLWRALEPDPPTSYHQKQAWHMIAGARSIFMLPKITDSLSYKKLCKARNIKQPLPRNLTAHQPIFTQIAQHKDFSCEWHTEMLFFSADWFKRRDDDPWIRFHHYLLESAWNKTEFWRNKFIFDFMWDSFVKGLSKENVTTKPYIVDIVKHLIIIALGVLPGFAPALDNEFAPVLQLQNNFIEIYGLKNFSPTIMTLFYFNPNDEKSRPVYWSLQLPAYFESMPKSRTTNSIMEDLREIKYLLDLFTSAVIQGNVKGIADTPIENCIKKVRFDYFHSDPDPEAKIRLVSEIPIEDPTFTKYGKNRNKKFSQISPFVRGCIRISHPKKSDRD